MGRGLPISRNERVAAMFRRCLTRAPDAEELTLLARFHDEQLARLERGELAAREVLGDAMDAAGRDSNVRAALVLTARCVLNLDEFITQH